MEEPIDPAEPAVSVGYADQAEPCPPELLAIARANSEALERHMNETQNDVLVDFEQPKGISPRLRVVIDGMRPRNTKIYNERGEEITRDLRVHKIEVLVDGGCWDADARVTLSCYANVEVIDGITTIIKDPDPLKKRGWWNSLFGPLSVDY